MNRYNAFFCKMSDEEWEHFAARVLAHIGFQILTLPAYGTDGGKDFTVGYDNRTYIVSCKHYIRSRKHVGIDNELNISDRLLQFNATGFIGFYSTGITTGLQERLNAICKNGKYTYCIYDPTIITQIMQSMDTKVLQSFGLYPHKYYMNVSEEEYKPLKCMRCEKDILADENIPGSLVGLVRLKDGKYEYAYGCKSCFIGDQLHYGVHFEIEQVLHVSILQYWENLVDDWIKEGIELSEAFYKNRIEFLNGIRQRQLPQTEGTWYGIC